MPAGGVFSDLTKMFTIQTKSVTATVGNTTTFI